MDKTMIMDAFHRGLLSKEECTKLLGIDLNIFIEDKSELDKNFNIESTVIKNLKGLK